MAVLYERQQFSVDLIFECRAPPVRRARDDFQCSSLDDLGLLHSRRADLYNLVVVAMQDQRRYVEFLEILCKIGL